MLAPVEVRTMSDHKNIQFHKQCDFCWESDWCNLFGMAWMCVACQEERDQYE